MVLGKYIIMKIAIHHREGSFSDGWIKYCQDSNIEFKIVNAYANDIINQIKGCDCFFWHHNHTNYKDKLFAKQLLFSLENMGIKVFPDFNTCWHFDDKVGQKYLFESINAPIVPTYVYYDKQSALEWANNTTYPKVFKLKGGASSTNVTLLKNKRECKSIINKAFSKGFKSQNYWSLFKDKFKLLFKGKARILDVIKFLLYCLFPFLSNSRLNPREIGYVYFQDFIPENDYDTRLIIIENKAYGMHRKVRTGDFRASGSSEYSYEPIRKDVIKLGFEIADKLKLQAAAFDFIYKSNGSPLLVEVSYGFGTSGSNKCKGYWDRSLNFNPCQIRPYEWILDNVLSK